MTTNAPKQSLHEGLNYLVTVLTQDQQKQEAAKWSKDENARDAIKSLIKIDPLYGFGLMVVSYMDSLMKPNALAYKQTRGVGKALTSYLYTVATGPGYIHKEVFDELIKCMKENTCPSRSTTDNVPDSVNVLKEAIRDYMKTNDTAMDMLTVIVERSFNESDGSIVRHTLRHIHDTLKQLGPSSEQAKPVDLNTWMKSSPKFLATLLIFLRVFRHTFTGFSLEWMRYYARLARRALNIARGTQQDMQVATPHQKENNQVLSPKDMDDVINKMEKYIENAKIDGMPMSILRAMSPEEAAELFDHGTSDRKVLYDNALRLIGKTYDDTQSTAHIMELLSDLLRHKNPNLIVLLMINLAYDLRYSSDEQLKKEPNSASCGGLAGVRRSLDYLLGRFAIPSGKAAASKLGDKLSDTMASGIVDSLQQRIKNLLSLAMTDEKREFILGMIHAFERLVMHGRSPLGPTTSVLLGEGSSGNQQDAQNKRNQHAAAAAGAQQAGAGQRRNLHAGGYKLHDPFHVNDNHNHYHRHHHYNHHVNKHLPMHALLADEDGGAPGRDPSFKLPRLLRSESGDGPLRMYVGAQLVNTASYHKWIDIVSGWAVDLSLGKSRLIMNIRSEVQDLLKRAILNTAHLKLVMAHAVASEKYPKGYALSFNDIFCAKKGPSYEVHKYISQRSKMSMRGFIASAISATVPTTTSSEQMDKTLSSSWLSKYRNALVHDVSHGGGGSRGRSGRPHHEASPSHRRQQQMDPHLRMGANNLTQWETMLKGMYKDEKERLWKSDQKAKKQECDSAVRKVQQRFAKSKGKRDSSSEMHAVMQDELDAKLRESFRADIVRTQELITLNILAYFVHYYGRNPSGLSPSPAGYYSPARASPPDMDADGKGLYLAWLADVTCAEIFARVSDVLASDAHTQSRLSKVVPDDSVRRTIDSRISDVETQLFGASSSR